MTPVAPDTERVREAEPRRARSASEGRRDGAPTKEVVASRYQVAERLGRGGMGDVYHALDTTSGRAVALKQMAPGHDAVRFRHEFHILAGLRHPRIVEVFDYGVDRGQPFYTMELLDGHDVRDAELQSVPEVCRILRDVASALALLHSRKLLHRDIAPRNVRCTRDGHAKLLDFGVLATMGVWGDVAGTLPCMAPEAVFGGALDQRADIFGLGALAYFVLTGKHAFPARQIGALVEAHQKRPTPPSMLAPWISEELEELVMSMITLEPLGRPSSAADVIDRLNAIGGLERAPELETARGYLASARMVGREREVRAVQGQLARVASAGGRSVVVRGRTGAGKSRLLRELALEAQLAGVVALRARGDDVGAEPFALIAHLAEEIARVAPDQAKRATEGRQAELSAAIPRLRATLDLPTVVELPLNARTDAREDRIARQRAVSEWVLDVAREKPLALLIDDVEQCDEASAATLAALAAAARASPLFLVVGLRTDVPARAPVAIRRLREHSLVLRMRGLREREVARLVREIFGEVANVDRLAKWVVETAGGNPMECTELIQALVERAIVQYVDGLWVIPEQLSRAEVLSSLMGSTDARVAALSEDARGLGKALAVLGGVFDLDLCARLVESEEEAFRALDDLVREEILIGSGEVYRFCHDSVRDALLRVIPPEDRAALELRVGHVLEATGPMTSERETRVGWHLLRGGDERRGAELLARAGRRFYDATSFGDAVAPLEAALDVFERKGATPRAIVEIRYMLLTGGFYADRELAVRHIDGTLEVLARHSGVSLARRLAPKVGNALSLVIGLVWAFLVHFFLGSRQQRVGPIEAIQLFMRAAVYAAGVAAFSFDTQMLRPLSRMAEPLLPLRRYQIADIDRFLRMLACYNLGRFDDVLRLGESSFVALARPDPIWTEVERRTAEGGARFQICMLHAHSGGPQAITEIEKLEALGLRVWQLGGLQLRTIHHLWRGEQTRADETWAKAEGDLIRLGSVWTVESVHFPAMTEAYAFVGDALGLKRAVESLRGMVDGGMAGWTAHLELARGEYHRLRGEYDLALEKVEHAASLLPEGEGYLRAPCASARAEILLALGRTDQALEAAISAMSEPDQGIAPMYWFRGARVRALALAARGDREQGLSSIGAAIERAKAIDNPFLTGSLHETAALIAKDAELAEIFEDHRKEVERFYRPTKNPILVARCERLLGEDKEQLIPTVPPPAQGE